MESPLTTGGTIAVILIILFGTLAVIGIIGMEDNRITKTERCYLPWSGQVMKTEMCETDIFCGPITKYLYYDDCKKFAILGAGE